MFSSNIEVMSSKQKPCVMMMTGENGRKYKFLLKGHEDLRQDERVMQFLKMINRLLEQSPTCEKRNLALVHYPVVPLSNNSGLIYWVPNADTYHSHMTKYRAQRNIPLSLEYMLMCWKYPEYDYDVK